MLKNLNISALDYVYNMSAYKNVAGIVISYIYWLRLQVYRHLNAEGYKNAVILEKRKSTAEIASTLGPSNSKKASSLILGMP